VKTLALVRHAKSSWDDPSIADHDRPLNERGRRDAPLMGARLHERGFAPGVILTSTATRAQATAEAIAAELGYPLDGIVVVPSLYGASPATMLAIVGGLEDSIDSALLVAHDPGMRELATRLSADIERMPTCAIAEFTFEVASWRDVPDAWPDTVRFDSPRRDEISPRG
jgi:phosphohistidine phosphatase